MALTFAMVLALASASTSTPAEVNAIKTNICTMNLLMANVNDMKFVTPLEIIAQFARFDVCQVIFLQFYDYFTVQILISR